METRVSKHILNIGLAIVGASAFYVAVTSWYLVSMLHMFISAGCAIALLELNGKRVTHL